MVYTQIIQRFRVKVLNSSISVFSLQTRQFQWEKSITFRPLGYERVFLPLYKVADAPFHIQSDDLLDEFLFRFKLYVCEYFSPTWSYVSR